VNEQRFYLDAGDDSAFAIFHPAEGSSAVLMCPPFGWDDICSYRSRRVWAERLAEAGHPTLRFDLPGTGDSAGSATDASRVEAWAAAVHGAAAWLRADSGRRRTVAIGIGLGGLLAMLVAAGGGPIDDFVLWAVPAGGRALLRELRTFARIEAANIAASGAPEPPPQPAGVLAPGGFIVTAETQAALEALELPGLPPQPGTRRRALLLGRDGIPAAKELARQLQDAGVEVDVADGDGYGAMMAPPDLARSPTAVFERVDAWLAAAPRDEAEPRRPPVPPTRGSIEIAVGAARVHERPVDVACGSGRLFGVLSEPAGVPPAELSLVLLNAGAIRRVGPNRMWVDFARRWTAQGVPAFRLDLEGIGDAAGEGERYTDVSELYVPEFVGQVRTALDALEARGVPPRFALLGLCSGAYWAFHAACADDRVSAAIMLNPRILFWDPRLDPARDARKLRGQLFDGRSWRKRLRGEDGLDMRRLISLTRWLAGSRADTPAASVAPAIERAFDELRDARKRAIFLFCDGEPLRDELYENALLPPPDRWPNVELEVLPGGDHTLRPLWTHEQVHAAVDRALAGELTRVPELSLARPASR
jgi:alpha-beta hydrolase superfamily lysophospholipase